MAQAIGFVQTGQRLGPAIGPVIGGLIAPLVGLRASFLVASGFYLLALVSVLVLYREPRDRSKPARVRGGRAVLMHLLRSKPFVLALGVIFGLQAVDRSFGPVLPLYVAQVGVSESRIPIVTGILFSLGAFSAAFGHHLAGVLMATRTPRTIIVSGTLVAGTAIATIILAPTLWLVGAAMLVVGIAIGVSTTTIYTVAGSSLPEDAHATGFGFMTTASLIGLALSPVAAGFIGGTGLRLVFVVDVLLLIVLAALVARGLKGFRVSVHPAPESNEPVSP